jgi:hypothetical protein
MLKRGLDCRGRGCVFAIAEEGERAHTSWGARGEWNWCHKEATRSDEGGCRSRWDWTGTGTGLGLGLDGRKECESVFERERAGGEESDESDGIVERVDGGWNVALGGRK